MRSGRLVRSLLAGVVGGALLTPGGCAAQAGQDDVVAAAPVQLAEHDGHQGVWLRSDALECFVAVQPSFRVLAMRVPGAESFMAESAAPRCGLRLAFMEPGESSRSHELRHAPATLLESSPTSARLRLNEAEDLQYDVSITLQDARAEALLDYQMTNVSDETRELAIWSIIAFEKRGKILAPLDKGGKGLRRLVTPRWSPVQHPTMEAGRAALLFDLTAEMPDAAYKLGLPTDAGWIAMVRGRHALVSVVPRQPAARYPEGDANVTLFYLANQDAAKTWAEIEQVGPLRELKPGEHTKMTERVVLLSMPEAADDPDALRKAVEAQIAAEATE